MNNLSEVFKKRIVCKFSGIENIISQKNIVYKTTNTSTLLFDAYMPQSTKLTQKFPAIILIHGEAPFPSMKDAGQYESLGQLIAAAGMVAISFNRRMLLTGSAIIDALQDIDQLIAYIRKDADQFNVDKNKLSIWSISAGVPFGLYAGLSKNPAYIKCLVAYYGFGDFITLARMINNRQVEEESANFPLIPLLNRRSHDIPPIFIARAGMDNPLLNESLDNFITNILANNLCADILNHPTGPHAFDVFDDSNRTHEILHKTLSFLKSNLFT